MRNPNGNGVGGKKSSKQFQSEETSYIEYKSVKNL